MEAIAACGVVETPAFVFDESRVLEAVGLTRALTLDSGCQLLYALKALSSGDVLRVLTEHVAGFSASSLFEAELARAILGAEGSVHITTPGFRPDEIPRLNDVCDYVALNSLSQLQRFAPTLTDVSVGLRVNPELSFVRDDRFNPCRRHSKLGVPLRTLSRVLDTTPELVTRIDGIHFHSNCDSTSFEPLLKTVRRISSKLDGLLHRLSWVNLGGGYLFTPDSRIEPLHEAVRLLTDRYEVEVFMEPGAALVRQAGWLVASVIDLVEDGRDTLAYLDTTVNHMPEVYEYQYEPDVLGDSTTGKHRYRLVGSTCLAGDTFGRYAFEEPLALGSRVVFPNMGAYTAVKAHMFNGVNLPATYVRRTTGELVLRKQFTYSDFAANWGEEEADASL